MVVGPGLTALIALSILGSHHHSVSRHQPRGPVRTLFCHISESASLPRVLSSSLAMARSSLPLLTLTSVLLRPGLGLITCPGFPGYCSESFPGQSCNVVCDFGRNNVPLCQVRTSQSAGRSDISAAFNSGWSGFSHYPDLR